MKLAQWYIVRASVVTLDFGKFMQGDQTIPDGKTKVHKAFGVYN